MKDTRLRIVMKFNQFSNLYIKCMNSWFIILSRATSFDIVTLNLNLSMKVIRKRSSRDYLFTYVFIILLNSIADIIETVYIRYNLNKNVDKSVVKDSSHTCTHARKKFLKNSYHSLQF